MTTVFLKGNIDSDSSYEKQIDEGVAFANYLFILETDLPLHVKAEKLFTLLETLIYCIYKRKGIIYNAKINNGDTIAKRFKHLLKVELIFDSKKLGLKSADEAETFFYKIKELRNLISHGNRLEADKREFNTYFERVSRFVFWYIDEYGLQDWRNMLDEHKTKYLTEYYEFLAKGPNAIYSEIISEINKKLIFLSQKTNDFNPNNFEIITKETFDKELLDEAPKKQYTMNYYTKFNNSPSVLKKIVANEICIPPDSIFKVKIEGEVGDKELSIEEIISKAAICQSVLVKIMTVGGVGKSTLLWHFSKLLSVKYPSFFLKKADSEAIRYIFTQIIAVKTSTPTFLFLDEIVSPENREYLIQLGENIAEFSSKAPVIFIVAERSFRYNKFVSKKQFEGNFDVIINLSNSNKISKNEVFDRLYRSLSGEIKNSSPSFKKKCFDIFCKNNSPSLIDCAYNLLVYLKRNVSTISYKFEWEDWHTFTSNEPYTHLKHLYEIVAFFYRYGVPVPIDFKSKFILNAYEKDPLLFLEALGETNNNDIPIAVDRGYLKLRHESNGDWYFRKVENSELRQKQILEDFLNGINNKEAVYLFRNLTESSEFKDSTLGKTLEIDRRIAIIKKFITNYSEINEEKAKAIFYLVDCLLEYGKGDEAISILIGYSEIDITNPRIFHRIGEFYLNRKEYKKAEKYFEESLKLDTKNMYPIGSLYKLYWETQNLFGLEKIKSRLIELAKEEIRFAIDLFKMIRRPEDICFYELEKLEEIANENLFFKTRLAKLYAEKGGHSEAVRLLKKIIALDERDAFALVQLGGIYFDSSRHEQFKNKSQLLLLSAKECFEKAVTMRPNNIYNYTELARIYFKQNAPKIAYKFLYTAFRIDSNNIAARNLFASSIYNKKIVKFKKRLFRMQRAQLMFFENLKIDKSNIHTIVLFARVNIKITNLLKNLNEKELEGIRNNKLFKQRNTDGKRLWEFNLNFLRRLLGKRNVYGNIKYHNKKIAFLLANYLFTYNQVYEAKLICELIIKKFPYDYEAGALLLKIYDCLRIKIKTKIKLLKRIINGGLTAANYTDFVEVLNHHKLNEFIIFVNKYKLDEITEWNSFQVIEFSVFLFQTGKADQSETLINTYIETKSETNNGVLYKIFLERVTHICKIYLVDLKLFESGPTYDDEIKKEMNRICIRAENAISNPTTIANIKYAIMLLSAVNGEHFSIFKIPHFESVKMLGQTYYKAFSKSEKDLKIATKYYQMAFDVRQNDRDLNNNFVNATIDLGAYDKVQYDEAIKLCKILQKLFSKDPLYLDLENEALSRKGKR